jgi:hypothetical protein
MNFYEFYYGYEKYYKYLNIEKAILKAKELLSADRGKYITKTISHIKNDWRENRKETQVIFENMRIVLEKNKVSLIGTPKIRLVEKIEYIKPEVKKVGMPYSPEEKIIKEKIIYDWQDAFKRYEGLWEDVKQIYAFSCNKNQYDRFVKMEDTEIVCINIHMEEIKFEDEVSK